jgi:hypothetical protein
MKERKTFKALKAAGLNLIVQSGQPYIGFPFVKDSLLIYTSTVLIVYSELVSTRRSSMHSLLLW